MTTTAPAVPDRYALYYPRIHFRELEWVKATLLAFGRVYRIVPPDHPLDRDPPELRTISQRHGASAPLIFEVDPDLGAIELAQHRLQEQLASDSPRHLQDRFGLEATAAREATEGPYEIHSGKFNGGLLELLRSRSLAWRSDRPAIPGNWVRVHPELGDAIMSMTAIACARAKGSDVVTDAEELHGAVAALDEDAVLRELMMPRMADATENELGVDRVAAELAHVVMTTEFDVSALSFADIAKIVRDGADLRAFRQQLATFAQRVPPELDQNAREQRLEEISHEVVAEWKRVQEGLPKKLLSGAGSGATKASEDLAKDKDAVKGLVGLGVAGAVAGAAKLTSAAVLTALAPASVPIAFAIIGAAVVWRRTRSDGPLRYLTRVRRAGGVQLMVPASYRRAGV